MLLAQVCLLRALCSSHSLMSRQALIMQSKCLRCHILNLSTEVMAARDMSLRLDSPLLMYM